MTRRQALQGGGAARPKLLPLTALLLGMALSGCASLRLPAGTEHAGVAVPARWAQQSADPSAPLAPTDLAAWWQRFGDAELAALVGQALQANPEIGVARAALRQARAVRRVAGAALLPAVNATASGQRSRSEGASGSNLFQAGLDASWEPDLFGGTRSGVAAAEADVRASAASLGDVQVSIAAEAALAYLDVRTAQGRLALARSTLQSQQDTLQIAQWRQQAGLIGALDVEQAATAAAQTRAQLPPLEAAIARGASSLAVLTGQAPGAMQARLAGTAPLPAAPPDLALSFPAQTLARRADLRAAEARVEAAASRTRQADAARYPSLRLSGSLGLSALTLGGLAGAGAVAGALLAGLSLPVFDGGAAAATVDAQAAAYDQARESQRQSVLVALKDVEDALVALRTARERLATLRGAVETAGRADTLARQQYAAGLVGFPTVLETQRSLLSAQDGAATAEAEVLADHVRLYKALGGGWEPERAAQAAAVPPTATGVAAAAQSPAEPAATTAHPSR